MFLTLTELVEDFKTAKFPSPSGALMFLTGFNRRSSTIFKISVSVPFRGFDVFNNEKQIVNLMQSLFPSPSGALMFLTFLTLTYDDYHLPTEFPSPSGALMFLTDLDELKETIIIKFPSPSGALMFLTLLVTYLKNSMVSFRPLPGL